MKSQISVRAIHTESEVIRKADGLNQDEVTFDECGEIECKLLFNI